MGRHGARGAPAGRVEVGKRFMIEFNDLWRGHPINERDLREVLGHTPLEVVGGILLGLVVATGQWLIWH